MVLTKQELLRYRNISAEIEVLRKQLKNIEPEFTTDSVTGSDVDYPFTKHSMTIYGYNERDYKKKILRLRNKIDKKLNELVEEKDKLMEYIYSVDDSRIRQILIHRYVDGLSWKAIGEKMKYGTSTVRMIHDSFIKRLAPFSTSKML